MALLPLQGNVYLVTGSTDGIGKHTALKLAYGGGTVLVHGRDAQRVSSTVEEIKKVTKNKSITGFCQDLSSLQGVRQLAAQVSQSQPKVDVLINNAGVYEPSKRLSADGFEMTWAVNVLAPFLLTSLLFQNVTSRIVNVSSISASSQIDFNNLNQEQRYSAHDAYSLSKLCSIIFTLRLAEILKRRGMSIATNCLDPGTVNTKMLQAGWGMIGMSIDRAEYEYLAATDPALTHPNVTGAYFVGHQQARVPAIALDTAVQDRLWALWEKQTGAKF